MSLKEERAIAQKYIGDFPWFMVIWGLGGFFGWIALFPLVHLDYIPLWLGFLLATINLCYCYLPTHEAQHGNIGRPGTRWRWLNEFIGHTSAFPSLVPYRLHRAIHLKHHAHANDNERDPDIYIRAGSVWGAAWNAYMSKQPGRAGALADNVIEPTQFAVLDSGVATLDRPLAPEAETGAGSAFGHAHRLADHAHPGLERVCAGTADAVVATARDRGYLHPGNIVLGAASPAA